jgi:hypothetical protein
MASKKKPTATMDGVLRDREKFINETKGVSGLLSSLFRSILLAKNIGGMSWSSYMRRWLSDPRNRIRPTNKDHAGARTNINRVLFDDRMTWKVFYMGLTFLRFKHAKLTLELIDENNKPLTVKLDFHITEDDLGGNDDALAGDAESDQNNEIKDQ